MIVLTLDGGLANVGGALWEVPVLPVYAGDLKHNLVRTFTLMTTAKHGDDDARISRLVVGLRDELAGLPVEYAFVEWNAFAGTYLNRQLRSRAAKQDRNAGDVARANRASAALYGALIAWGIEASFVNADSTSKARRAGMLQTLGMHGDNEHQRDALAVGLRVLTDARRWRQGA